MFRTQVYLTELERKQLLILSEESGLPQSALIREALDQFIERKRHAKKIKQSAIKAAAGIWEKRTDLPDFHSLRRELDMRYEHE